MSSGRTVNKFTGEGTKAAEDQEDKIDASGVRRPKSFPHTLLLALLLVGTPGAAHTRLGNISGTVTDESLANLLVSGFDLRTRFLTKGNPESQRNKT